MAYSAILQRRFGLAKESVRGTAEASPTKWYPILKESDFDYKLLLLKDEAIRGVLEPYPMVAGRKRGTGKVRMPLDAQTVGEFFYSLLGTVASVQQGGTAAYKHTFTLSNSSISRPAYTFFLDRGMNVLKYNLGVVKKISLTGPVDGLIMFDADVLFKTEAAGAIGSPSFPTQRYFAFQNATVKVGGAAVTDIKNWSCEIDGGSEPVELLSQSQDLADILVRSGLRVNGQFTILFQNATERDKFIAGTTNSLQFLIEGAIIASTFKWTVDVTVPKMTYTAYPYDEDDGLLAAKVTYEGVYDSSSTKAINVDVINTDVSY